MALEERNSLYLLSKYIETTKLWLEYLIVFSKNIKNLKKYTMPSITSGDSAIKELYVSLTYIYDYNESLSQ